MAGDPAPVAAAIAGLLRILPGPMSDPTATPDTVAAWSTAKADLLDRVATASADPDLAARAAACAARARRAARREP